MLPFLLHFLHFFFLFGFFAIACFILFCLFDKIRLQKSRKRFPHITRTHW